MKKSIVFRYKVRNFEEGTHPKTKKNNIMKTHEILDFFRENDCKVSCFENRTGEWLFEIFSNELGKWILTDANEFMLKGFYLKCIKN